ncbi:hypothetical protein [Algoriphagus winogradskyi]|uniref:Uncharacterized protein n=1 Tax=Algoriphagus winogradskyi TaxID=237017 RepID=A0ABY1NT16_9BACT|nr:hypothetical protein [Algoriphagus winogradskyi]SMP16148.1 hypothetical protein SAMN06265367_102586 [Algoriphagus winogradskyi]
MVATLKIEQSQRVVNIVFQILLILILIFGNISTIAIPRGIIGWQISHFFLIAVADFYVDDFREPKLKYSLLLYAAFAVFILFSLSENVFDKLYIRLHGAILILGNLLGRKIDRPFWKHITVVYLLILCVYEYRNNEMTQDLITISAYSVVAILILGLVEKLSERHKNFWMLHSSLLFVWIIYQGPYYREAFVFLIGGTAYELTKLFINELGFNFVFKKDKGSMG